MAHPSGTFGRAAPALCTFRIGSPAALALPDTRGLEMEITGLLALPNSSTFQLAGDIAHVKGLADVQSRNIHFDRSKCTGRTLPLCNGAHAPRCHRSSHTDSPMGTVVRVTITL